MWEVDSLSVSEPVTNNPGNLSSGYSGGRHLSERDLPSKVLEHSQDTPAPSHLHQAPRMQASKSVPSLNSECSSPLAQLVLQVFRRHFLSCSTQQLFMCFTSDESFGWV